MITVQKTSGATSELISNTADYLIWFAKSKSDVKYRQLYELKVLDGAGGGEYQYLKLPGGVTRRIAESERSNYPELAAKGSFYASHPITSQRPPGDFPVDFMGDKIRPRSGYWKTGEVGFPRLIKADRVLPAGSILKYRRFFEDFPVMPRNNLWGDVSSGASASDPKVYAVQTTPRVIERCLLMTTDPGDLVLDPTCGSGTTAFVAEKWGRRWITCDTSRVAVTLAKQRLMTASFDYYRFGHWTSDVVFKPAEIIDVVLKHANKQASVSTA